MWARRGLQFWADVFENYCAGCEAGNAKTLGEQMMASYERLLKPFHGFISRRGFSLANKVTPGWETVMERAELASSDEELREDLRKWAGAMQPLVETMTAMHEKLDLEDKRKSI